jgi:signal transduction histidine kinase
MQQQGGLRRRMLFASMALGVLVGAAFVVLIVTIVNVREQQQARGHSEKVIAAANHLQQLVLDLDADARRFAIKGNLIYLGPLRVASQNLEVASKQLVDLSQGDPTRALRAQQLEDGVRSHANTWVARVIEIAIRNPKQAKELVLGTAGLRDQERLRKQFDTFVNTEQEHSDMSRAVADRTERYAIVLGGIGLVGSLILIGLYAVYVSRQVVQPVRRVAAATQRLAGGQLQERVPVSGGDEIAELASSFNSMAESIESQQRELAGQNTDLERLATVLRSVIDSTIDAIVLTDLQGNVQLANRPLLRLAGELGFSGEGNTIDQLLSVADKMADRDNYVEMLKRLRAHPEEPSADEFELLDPYRVFIGFTAPVRSDGGSLIGRIWTLREATQERELDRLKNEFVATVSHELRTPLTSMMGFLEMLREGEAGELLPEQERFLSIVHRSSERLQRLVGDLLFIARLDAGGLQLHLADGVPLDDVVSEAVEAASADARSHEVDLRLERDGAVEVRGDRERLGQLVSNLISNAVKFTPAGGNVTARVFAESGLGVIEIEDTGIGIPKAEQDRLFQRFFRASTATDQAIPGTGLGLAITKAIAEAHDGQISFRSQPGEGTTFRLELPL